MGASIYPVLDRPVPGFDAALASAVSGQALAQAAFGDGSPLSPLTRFVSHDEEELAAFLEDETGLERDAMAAPVPAEEWFDPAEGLQVVRDLLSAVRAAPESLVGAAELEEEDPQALAEAVVGDLEEMEKVLTLAQQNGARFHLSVDF